jgi:hypothetical protein
MRRHYLDRLIELREQLPRGAGVLHVTVRHDDDCPRLADPAAECTCDPEIDAPSAVPPTTSKR